ncbi:glyoxylase I 4 [Vigna angularis]|uniref:glyoxylase I 4 n=1 Tax=Phaseolus angularis TaxID=3914 RepID=UPI0022B47F56|nr:glyoxylase I 4 [Vigna angularis]
MWKTYEKRAKTKAAHELVMLRDRGAVVVCLAKNGGASSNFDYQLDSFTPSLELKLKVFTVNEMQQKVVKGEERKIARKAEDSRNENRTPLMALNHISRLCRNVKESIDFYTKVLGFVQTKRPQALDSKGARLFNYGVDIHLVQSKEEDQRLPSNSQHLDPQENHISFQCEDLEAMEKKLKKMNVKFMKRTIEAEDGTFFSSPMCNTTNQSFSLN